MRSRSRTLAIGVTVLTVVAAIVAAVVLLTGGGDGRPGGTDRVEPDSPRTRPIAAVQASAVRQTPVVRFTGPGYVAWTGAWTAPGGDLMTSWVQAEGPLDPQARGLAPQSVLDAFGFTRADIRPERDFWELDTSVRVARSPDGGQTWDVVRTDPFQAVAPHSYSQQPTTALPDGTLIRRVNGDDLRHDEDLPHTAVLQRLEPGTEEWGEPQVLLDPAEHTYQITRIRRLTDGRLIATGNAWDVPATTTPAERRARGVPSRFLIMVSRDDGRSWEEALTIPEGTGPLPGNEWDTAELPGGDLFAVMRTGTTADRDTAEPVVKQAILRQRGGGWTLEDLRVAPFPVTGHPELLRTQEGAILYVATDGVRWTQDGRRWEPVSFPGATPYRSHYYPRALQTSDGRIHVFSHLGADDPYEDARHGVLHDSFTIDVQPGPGGDT